MARRLPVKCWRCGGLAETVGAWREWTWRLRVGNPICDGCWHQLLHFLTGRPIAGCAGLDADGFISPLCRAKAYAIGDRR
jgi:hypothetical protein